MGGREAAVVAESTPEQKGLKAMMLSFELALVSQQRCDRMCRERLQKQWRMWRKGSMRRAQEGCGKADKQPRVSREGDGGGEHRTVIHQVSPTGNVSFFM